MAKQKKKEKQEPIQELIAETKKKIIMTPELSERLQNGSIKGDRPKKNMMYCPYCECWTYWKPDENEYKRSQCCGISDADYYVKRYNNSW